MGYNLLIDAVYGGYNPLTNFIVTSWDFQVDQWLCLSPKDLPCPCAVGEWSDWSSCAGDCDGARFMGKNQNDLGELLSLRIQICPKKGISPVILLWAWDWDHQTYSREGYGSLGYGDLFQLFCVFFNAGLLLMGDFLFHHVICWGIIFFRIFWECFFFRRLWGFQVFQDGITGGSDLSQETVVFQAMKEIRLFSVDRGFCNRDCNKPSTRIRY